MPGARPLAVAAAIVAGTVLSAVLFDGTLVNVDGQWALNWGRDIANARMPEFELDGASTPHPLTIGVAALSALIAGDGADGVMHVVAFMAFAGLVVGGALLALELGGRWAAAVAAVALATLPPAVSNTSIVFEDAATATLVVVAVLLAVRDPERPLRVLAVLALAGLLRPEIWGVSVLYAVWGVLTVPGTPRLPLALLAAAGPVGWSLMDLVVTGEVLSSFTNTRRGAEIAERTTGLTAGPGELYEGLRNGLGRAWLLGGAAGFAVVAWRGLHGMRAQLVAPGAAAALGAAFLVLAAGRLSLLERYLIPLMAVLCILSGVAVAEWTRTAGGARVAWALVAVALLGLAAIELPDRIDRIRAEVDGQRAGQVAVDGLNALGAGPARVNAAGCDTVAAYNYRVRSYLAWALDRRPQRIVLAEDPGRLDGSVAWFAPRTRAAVQDLAVISDPTLGPPPAPAGFADAARTRDWTLFTRGC